MTEELEPYEPGLANIPGTTRWVSMLAPAAELAKQIAGTEFVPSAFRNAPAQITAAILYGQELGIGPMQALAKIDIIEGRPAPRAELARALALAAGHDIWVVEQTNTKCTIAGKRHNSDEVQRVTWTMDDAKKAGIDGRQNWRRYPRQMLLARASAELVRMAFPDVLGGIALFAEELEGDVLASVTPLPTTDTPPPATKRRQRAGTTPPAPITPTEAPAAAPVPLLPGETDEPFPPLPGDEPATVDRATDKQIVALQTIYGTVGIEPAHRKPFARGVLNLDLPLASHHDLTTGQASTLIDRLKDVEEGRADIIRDANGIPTRIESWADPKAAG